MTGHRLDGVDAGRVLAVLLVMHLHVGAFRGAPWTGTVPGALSDGLAVVARLAVPYFFICSGYFLGRQGAAGAPIRSRAGRQVRRLLILFLAWSAIYVAALAMFHSVHRGRLAAVQETLRERLGWALDRPVTFVLQGPQEHLWFLPALGLGLGLVALARDAGLGSRATLGTGALLYALTLAAGPYREIWPGLPGAFSLRNGPFVALLFVALGERLARGRLPAPRVAAALLAGGLGLAFVEAWLASRLWGFDPSSHDALVGLVPAALGLFALAVQAGGLAPTWLSRGGRLTLGVYAGHMLVAALVERGLGGLAPVAAELARPGLVALGAVTLAAAMARLPRLRALVA